MVPGTGAGLAEAFAPDPITGSRALLTCVPQEHGPLDRALREQAVALASDDHAVRELPGVHLIDIATLA